MDSREDVMDLLHRRFRKELGSQEEDDMDITAKDLNCDDYVIDGKLVIKDGVIVSNSKK